MYALYTHYPSMSIGFICFYYKKRNRLVTLILKCCNQMEKRCKTIPENEILRLQEYMPSENNCIVLSEVVLQ